MDAPRICAVTFSFYSGVVDVVAEFASEGALSELLYADDLFLMSDTIKVLCNKFFKWRLLRAWFES